MQPQIETLGTTGITATFADGATISMTITGLFPCSACDEAQCKHFHAALPHWNRFRWEMAERQDSPWGPRLLESIGIVPPYIVRPDYFTKQTRWAPFGKGEEIAPGVRTWDTEGGDHSTLGGVKFLNSLSPLAPSVHVWYTRHGRLYRFGDEGHVYIGADHPDGHTDCLVCRGGCDHVERALALEGEA